jgi:protocatechuate 3,4-dioxygenase beta subunit
MKTLRKNPALLAIIVVLISITFLYSRSQSLQGPQENQPEQILTDPATPETETATDCTPTFRDGGGPYYKSNAPFRNKISPDNHSGEKLIVEGKILRNDCKTLVAEAVLDVWQANETGNYEDEWYRGQVRTSADGSYMFETVIPKGYGQGTGYRPPHIHFKVFVGGTEAVTSQMFFPEAKGRAGFDDAYIMTLETKQEAGQTIHYGYHNIILP